MKKIIVFLIFAVSVVFYTGCNSGESTDEKVKRLEKENEELRSIEQNKNQFIEEMSSTLNGIQDTLGIIQTMITRENMSIKLIEKSNELGKQVQQSQKDEIMSSLQLIANDLKAKRNNIAALNKKLKDSNFRISGLEKLLANYEGIIKKNEEEIATMKMKIDELQQQNQQLSAQNQELTKSNVELGQTVEKTKTELSKMTKTSNTIYYKVGNNDELIDGGYVVKTGGVLGLGRTMQLSPGININKFKDEIDLSDENKIFINKNIELIDKLVPQRDENTYSLTSRGNGTVLEIKDKNAFLKVSKYLVIVIDE